MKIAVTMYPLDQLGGIVSNIEKVTSAKARLTENKMKNCVRAMLKFLHTCTQVLLGYSSPASS